MSPIRIVAAILIVGAGVLLFVSDDSKWWVLPLIIGNLLALWDDRRSREP